MVDNNHVDLNHSCHQIIMVFKIPLVFPLCEGKSESNVYDLKISPNSPNAPPPSMECVVGRECGWGASVMRFDSSLHDLLSKDI